MKPSHPPVHQIELRIAALSELFYAAGGDLKSLADSNVCVIEMLHTIRQALSALRTQGIPVTSAKLRGRELLPDWLLVRACRWALRTSYADLIVARHTTVSHVGQRTDQSSRNAQTQGS